MCWTYTGLLSGCFHVLVCLQGLFSAFVHVLDLYQESFLDLFCVEFIQGLFLNISYVLDLQNDCLVDFLCWI